MEEATNRAAYDDDDDDDGDYEDSWISWFCSLEGNEFIAEVDEDYIRDRFNLFGLKPQIPGFEKNMMTILNGEPSPEDVSDPESSELFHGARDLYGLVHARYIVSPRGLAVMKEKFMRGVFGQCPRVLCDRQNCLPVGLTDKLEEYNVRLYCPKCQEAYEVSRQPGRLADGAYFGTSFPHIFLQTFPNLVPLDAPVSYQPKIFGFRVHAKKSIIQRKLESGEYGQSLLPQPINSRQLQVPGGTESRQRTFDDSANHSREGVPRNHQDMSKPVLANDSINEPAEALQTFSPNRSDTHTRRAPEYGFTSSNTGNVSMSAPFAISQQERLRAIDSNGDAVSSSSYRGVGPGGINGPQIIASSGRKAAAR